MQVSKLTMAIIVLAIVLSPSAGYSQIGNRILNKAKNKTQQRIDKKVDKSIDKGLDETEEQLKKKEKEDEQQNKPVEKPQVTMDTTRTKTFTKFDFIPGEKILYNENFEQESIGELPVGWNTSGTGEVVKLTGQSENWLRLHNPFVYLTNNTRPFGDNYTVEFDVLLNLKNNGWMYPELSVGFLSSGKESPGSNVFLKEYKKYAAIVATIIPGEFKSTKILLNSFENNANYFKGDPKAFSNLEQWYGKKFHVSVQVQKERYRLWLNEEKIFDVPKGVSLKHPINQLFFMVGRTNYSEDQYGIYITNIKIATGRPDLRHKLIEEGKFSTTAILFDINKTTIKPESGGVLKEIADVLKQFPEVKIKITGHTDSDGKDADNLALSKGRALSVKASLVNEFGIAEERISTDGKGETIPLGDNKTKEGKAQNRRVEFEKI